MGLPIYYSLFLGSFRLVDFEPLILLDLLESESQLRVRHQDVLNEVPDFIGEVAGELVTCREDLLVETLGVLIFKGEVATDQTEEHHASTPDIGFRSIVLKAFNKFWSRIAGRSTSCQ
jgi:hypothetical protein